MRELDAWEMPLGGTALIEASAGTGKTYTLTTLYLRLLVEHDLEPSQILVVTYTQAATAELRVRVRERIEQALVAGEMRGDDEPSDGEEARLRALARKARDASRRRGRLDPLRRALQGFDEAAIFTIHGFCQRTLQENAFESGLAADVELVEEADAIQRTLAHDLWLRLTADLDPSFLAWLLDGAGKRWQFEPDALKRDLLERLGADERMPIIPEVEADATAPAAVEDLARRIDSAMLDWASSWRGRRERVAGLLLGDHDLNKRSFAKTTIETKWLPAFDAFADRIERRPPDAPLHALELPEHFEKLTTDFIASRVNKGGKPVEDPCFAAFDALALTVADLSAAYEREALELRRRFVVAAREAARERRGERHLLFFDDLLAELRAALERPGGERLASLLRERYRFALIDEFQDTDPVQYEIFRRVWHQVDGGSPCERGLILIGDPKQAIYSFRGADVFTYLDARTDAGDARYGLAVNYRSDPGLIAAVNALFAKRVDSFQIDRIDFDPVRPPPARVAGLSRPGRGEPGLRVLLGEHAALDEADRGGDRSGKDREGSKGASAGADDQRVEKQHAVRTGRTWLMAAVANDIVDLLDSGAQIDGRSIGASDIAILARKRRDLQYARSALERAGIACVDRGDHDVFESREAWELVSILRAMMRPADPPTLRGALSTGAHGYSAGELATLEDDAPALVAASERYAEYGRLWSQLGLGRAFESWRRAEGVSSRLLAWVDGERRLTNWLHLAELLQRFASDRKPSRRGLLSQLERAIASKDARAVWGRDATLLRLESDEEAVSLVTFHGSKGLEYPIVYLPSLWEKPRVVGPNVDHARSGTRRNPPIRFHDHQSSARTLDLAGHAAYADHLEQARREDFSEELRLLYVALTRAKHQCVLAWAAIRDAAKSPLAWLLSGFESKTSTLDRKAAIDELKHLGAEDWREIWQRVGEQAGVDSVAIESARFLRRERVSTLAASRPPLSYAAPMRRFEAPRRTTSFSALMREDTRASGPTHGPEVQGRDRDAEGRLARAEIPESSATAPDLGGEMHAFPRGAAAGTSLHDVLEQVDFARRREEASERIALREFAHRSLLRHRIDPDHLDQVMHVIDSVRETPLGSGSDAFRLAQVAPGQFRAEVEFTLWAGGSPIVAGEVESMQAAGSGLTPALLADALAKAPADSVLARYAERVRGMHFSQLNGFLRGYIDGVFHDGRRYCLLDYKSNHLGVRQADYRPEALVGPMIEHDYVLQYLFYTVAIDRHLAARVVDYDYERDFGGVYYLFLRGLAVDHEPGCGVFFDRPDPETIHSVSALLGASAIGRGEGGRPGHRVVAAGGPGR